MKICSWYATHSSEDLKLLYFKYNFFSWFFCLFCVLFGFFWFVLHAKVDRASKPQLTE